MDYRITFYVHESLQEPSVFWYCFSNHLRPLNVDCRIQMSKKAAQKLKRGAGFFWRRRRVRAPMKIIDVCDDELAESLQCLNSD